MAAAQDIKWSNHKALLALTVSTRRDFPVAQHPGLQFRVSVDGHKSWSFIYKRKADKKNRRVTIGPFPEVPFAVARKEWEGLRLRIRNGEDPAGVKADFKKLDTLADIIDRYEEQHLSSLRSGQEYSRILSVEVRPALGGYKITSVGRKEIQTVLNAIYSRGAKVAANRTRSVLHALYQWAIQQGYCEQNPVRSILPKRTERPRERVLSQEELRAFWFGLDTTDLSNGIKLVLRLAAVTGQRIGEICRCEIGHIDFATATWTIPNVSTKNGRSHVVPLSRLALDLFASAVSIAAANKVDISSCSCNEPDIARYVFPDRARTGKHLDRRSVSRAMNRCKVNLGLAAARATPHDLRRTFATELARLGTPQDIVSRILNHSEGPNRSVAEKVYVHYEFLKEKRRAMAAWEAELQQTILRLPVAEKQ